MIKEGKLQGNSLFLGMQFIICFIFKSVEKTSF